MQELISTLTEREREVYFLVCQGLHNKEIGKELGLSLGGVKFHVCNILDKLGARDRAGIINYGISRGQDAPLVGDGRSYDEAQIRAAGVMLVSLGLGNRKEVNETVINLLGVLGGKIK